MDDRLLPMARAWTPGDVLVVCNLADSKRRNWHLGFRACDEDIRVFDALIREVVGEGRAIRIGGDQWAALATAATPVTSLVERFAREEPLEVSYEVDGVAPGGERRHACLWTWRGVLRRAVRVVTTPLDGPGDVVEAVGRCSDIIHRYPVNVVSALPSAAVAASPWRCDDGLPMPAANVCLLCGGGRLAVEGGAEDVAEMRCDDCGADLEFRFRARLLPPQ